MGNFIDLTGRRFGKLVVIGKEKSVKLNDGHSTRIYYRCKCDCGNEIVVSRGNLGRNTFSCGCYRKEYMKNKFTKHGRKNSRIYNIWIAMKQRCNDKNSLSYNHYGGRGIKVCEEWNLDFINFYEWAINNGYEKNLTIDRINVNGNYEPSNCRWSTIEEQANNKRNSHLISYKDKTYTLTQWSKILNINVSTLKQRIRSGWSIDRAFTAPIKNKKI